MLLKHFGGYLNRQQGGCALLEGLENGGFDQRSPHPLANHAGAAHAAHSRTGPIEACLDNALKQWDRTWRVENGKRLCKQYNADLRRMLR